MDYTGVKKGALKLKGDSKTIGKKQKKKEKKEKSKIERGDDTEKKIDEDETAPVVPGTGRLLGSGTTIHGFDTKFLEEVSVGDALLVQHPATQCLESIKVTHVLTNKSMNILEAFSSDFTSTMPYHISKDSKLLKKKAKRDQDEADGDISDEELMRRKMQKDLDKRMKKSIGSRTIKVQQKIYGGGGVTYRTVDKVMDRTMGAEDSLDERVKLGRDKYCR